MLEVERAEVQCESLSAPLLQTDLLNDFDGLVGLLPAQLYGQYWLNAYLLAAGINQIVEDYLHPDPLALRRVAKNLRRLPRPAGILAAGLAQATAALIIALGRQSPATTRVIGWQRTWAGLVVRLAGLATGTETIDESRHAQLLAWTRALMRQASAFPVGLRSAVLRLPSSFRSFDQHPDDLERLVGEFARLGPPSPAPLLVVGVRTSGSYLAPLVATFLARQGYREVGVLTIRPGRPLLKHEESALAVVVREGGLVLVVDDPPASGAALAAAVADLERAGVPQESIVLLLQLFGDQSSLPDKLQRYRSLVLPWEEWSVHRRLEPPAVACTLTAMLAPAISVTGIERVDMLRRRWARSHARGLYRVRLTDTGSSDSRQEMILVKGVGLGYFGEHALAVAQAMQNYGPQLYGVHDGLIYRAWLPEKQGVNISPELHGALANAVAGYVVERGRRLAAVRDKTESLGGQGPVWEAASDILSRAFGRAGLAMRPLAVDRLVRRMLAPLRPAVIDGNMDVSRWFTVPDGSGQLVKVDADERAFSNLDLYSYDPVFDLAGAAAWETYAGWPEDLRRAYERLAQAPVDEERLLLYQLVHLWDAGRTGQMEPYDVRRASARALQRYFAARYFADLASPAAGPLCALDVDGVLESEVLGFPGLTPAGALALRGLLAHGYWPVLNTGRSLAEVKERCDAYRLPGGVAEYGSALYVRSEGCSESLVSPEGRASLERLREVLVETPAVYLDPAYQHIVRAYQVTAAGRQTALRPEVAQAAVVRAGIHGRVRAITGEAQTDFVACDVDKGTGLLALASRLGAATNSPDGPPIALAVGDGEADLPMFRLASLAAAPAHAGAAVRAPEVRVMRRAYQAGLAEAVALLLGHHPGDCPHCRKAPVTPEAGMFELALGAQQSGSPGIVWQALRLVAGVRRL